MNPEGVPDRWGRGQAGTGDPPAAHEATMPRLCGGGSSMQAPVGGPVVQ